MAGGVDQVQNIIFPIVRFIVNPNCVGLNRNPALAFDVHAVEHLLLHVTILHCARLLNEAVSKGGFPVVNMRHDREITDFAQVCHRRDMSGFCALVKALHTY